MRGLVPGLDNPSPMRWQLPSAFQDNRFALGFVGAMDEALAPILSTVDNIDAYLDPDLTPPDFLPWLASCVGVVIDENWSEEQQRRLVSKAVELYRFRGTRRGIVQLISLYVGVEEGAIDVTDSGGAVWSVTPGGSPPGEARAQVQVRVRVADPADLDRERIERLVAGAIPAHLSMQVEVVAA